MQEMHHNMSYVTPSLQELADSINLTSADCRVQLISQFQFLIIGEVSAQRRCVFVSEATRTPHELQTLDSHAGLFT